MAKTFLRDETVRIIEPEPGRLRENVESTQDENSLKRALETVVRNRALLSCITAAAMLCGLAYILISPARYTASALMIIDLHSHAELGAAGASATDPNVDSANIESQIEVLKSEHVLLKLVDAEHLVDDPEFAPGYFETHMNQLGRWLSFGQGQSSEEGNARSVEVARALQKVTYARRIGLTYTIEVGATMATAAQAAKIANAYAQAFIADQADRQEESTKRASELLRQRTAELQSQTEDSERAVEDLKYLGSQAGANSASARVSLQRLESTARAYSSLHDKFLDLYAGTLQQRFIAMPEAQVVSEAFPPSSKSGPKRTTIMALAIFIGFTLGLVIIALRDRTMLGMKK